MYVFFPRHFVQRTRETCDSRSRSCLFAVPFGFGDAFVRVNALNERARIRVLFGHGI